MFEEKLKKHQKLNNNLVEQIVNFAGDVKPPILYMAECLDKPDLDVEEIKTIIPELSKQLTIVNDRLNKFIGFVTTLYINNNPRD